jgi:hypothetical protein
VFHVQKEKRTRRKEAMTTHPRFGHHGLGEHYRGK